MAYKSSIGNTGRDFHVSKGGADLESGLTVETAKLTLLSAITAINNLSPSLSESNRASLIVEGIGVFTENVVFPQFTDYSGIGITNTSATGNIHTLNSFSSYKLGSVAADATSSKLIQITDKINTTFSAEHFDITAIEGIGLEITGDSQEIHGSIDSVKCIANTATIVNYENSGTGSAIVKFNKIVIGLNGDSTTVIYCNPSDSNSNLIVNFNSIEADTENISGDFGLVIDDGTLFCQGSELICTQAIQVNGGICNTNINKVQGHITVSTGATLNCNIEHYISGTVTNNGTINGRIGNTTYGNYNNLNNIAVPLPAGYKRGLVYENNAYTWEEITDDDFTLSSVTSETPVNALGGEGFEVVLGVDNSNAVINLPSLITARASIRINTIFVLGNGLLEVNSDDVNELQFVDENGVSNFDNQFTTNINRPVLLRLFSDRWRIEL